MQKNFKLYALMLITTAIINALFFYDAFFMNNTELSAEGGVIESITAFSFLFAGVLLMFQTLSKQGFEQRLTQFFSVTTLLLFLREVDVEDYNLPSLIKCVGSGDGRDMLFVTLYLVLIGLILKSYRIGLVKKVAISFRSHVALTVLAGCVLLIIGGVFENFHNEFIEEIMEMNGGLLIMLASILHLQTPIYSGVSEN